MNLRQLITRFRKQTVDTKQPYMWSDEEIIEFANDAEEEACRRSGLLVDSTSKASIAYLTAGDSEIELDDSVIYVRRARIVGGITLRPRVSADMDEYVPGWEDATASYPLIFVPDWETGKLKLYPPTSGDIEVQMTVIRVPLSEMAEDEDEPEISGRYHGALLDWMMFLAYSKQDADAYDYTKALKFEERFTAEFGQPSSAKDERWALEQYYDIGNN